MTRHLRSPAFLLVCVLLLPPAAGARGDSWASPKTRKVPSADGRYTALVVPADRRARDARAKTHVYEGEPGEGGRWQTVWAVTLSNRVAPVEAFLSNDGAHLVTLDNWHDVGGGEDTVAFYAREGAGGRQLARYALDQFLVREEILRAERSVSSTWWRRHGYTFFEDPAGPGDPTLLCVWLEVGSRWAVWDATTGKPVGVEPGGPLDRRLTAKARERALEQTRWRESGDVAGALRLLGHARDPRDRPEIEQFLRAGDFPQFEQYGRGEPFVVTVESGTRREADRALVRHAGKPVAEEGRWGRGAVGAWRYVHLGTLEVPVTFDPPLARVVRHRAFVYLVPEDVPEDAWPGLQLEHRGVLALRPLAETQPQAHPQSAPQTRPHTRPTTVPASGAAAVVRFRGVTPGRYWIKVVHDRAKPHHAGDPRRAVAPSPGDVQSAGRPLVEVRAGEEVRADAVRCVDRVLDAREAP